MRHQWTEVSRGIDRCHCGLLRFRYPGERRYPQYAATMGGVRVDNASECGAAAINADDERQTSFAWTMDLRR